MQLKSNQDKQKEKVRESVNLIQLKETLLDFEISLFDRMYKNK